MEKYALPASLVLLLGMAMIALSCGEAAEQPQEIQRDPFASDGPLMGMLIAGDVDANGGPVRLGLTFPDTAAQIAAIVPLGDAATGDDLSITWYRVSGPGQRERLFEHTIKPQTFATAYSVGLSQGRLLPGLYEVVARTGEHEVWSPVIVRETSTPAEQGPDQLAASPASGESGIYPINDEASSANPEFSGGQGESQPDPDCRLAVTGIYLAFVHSEVLGLGDQCGELGLAAAMQGGEPVLVAKGQRHIAEMFHPCELPGGSDLPGAVIVLAGFRAAGGEGEREALATIDIKDLGLPPAIEIQSAPPPKSTVEPGQTITFQVVVYDQPPSLGIRSAELRGPSGVIAREDKSEPVACDIKRHASLLKGSYTVPDNPPPVIEFQVEAVGQNGMKDVAKAQFYTGEIWEGTITEDFAPGGNRVVAEGKVRLVAGADGSVAGAGAVTFTRCNVPNCSLVGTTQALTFSGSLDDGGFNLTTTGPGGSIALAGPTEDGSAKLVYQEAGGTITLDLKCTTC